MDRNDYGSDPQESITDVVGVLTVAASAGLIGYVLGAERYRRAFYEAVFARQRAEPSSAIAEPRNAGLTYRPLGATGEPYPDWVRALDGKSGVYVIREIQRDGAWDTVYVGESHANRLYDTLTRHFQRWRRSKKFWTGQYGGQGHDPGLTYPRDRVTVAVRVLSPERAIAEEARLIARLRPRDNLIGQPTDEADDVVPF
jgi:hypothetical protein